MPKLKRFFAVSFVAGLLATFLLLAGLLAQTNQPDNRRNSRSVSAANTAVTASIAAVTAQQVHLYSVAARCSAGTAQLQVKDAIGGAVIYDTSATEVAATTFRWTFAPPLSNPVGNGMDVVLGACGAGNTGTLIVHASQN